MAIPSCSGTMTTQGSARGMHVSGEVRNGAGKGCLHCTRPPKLSSDVREGWTLKIFLIFHFFLIFFFFSLAALLLFLHLSLPQLSSSLWTFLIPFSLTSVTAASHGPAAPGRPSSAPFLAAGRESGSLHSYPRTLTKSYKQPKTQRS